MQLLWSILRNITKYSSCGYCYDLKSYDHGLGLLAFIHFQSPLQAALPSLSFFQLVYRSRVFLLSGYKKRKKGKKMEISGHVAKVNRR